MSVEGIVAAGRTAAQQLMVDTVTINRTASAVLNESSGTYATTDGAIYTGGARVKPLAIGGVIGGQTEYAQGRYMVTLPHAAIQEVQRDDQVTVTDSTDVRLVGKVLTVRGVQWSATATARRLECEELQ